LSHHPYFQGKFLQAMARQAIVSEKKDHAKYLNTTLSSNVIIIYLEVWLFI